MEQTKFNQLYADVRTMLDEVGEKVDPVLAARIVSELNVLRESFQGACNTEQLLFD